MSSYARSVKKVRVIVIALIASITALGVIAKLRKPVTTNTFRKVRISRSDIVGKVSSTATVQPQNRLEIKAPVAGRLEQILTREGERIRRGKVLAWMSSNERATMLDVARSEGPDELRRWEQDYRPTPILAPIDGTIILKSVEVGQTFSASDALFVMSNHLIVVARVDETDIANIALNQAAQIVLDAYPDHIIEGRVSQIAYEAKTINNVTTYSVNVHPKNAPNFMRSGMSATITFNYSSRGQVISIPNEALRVYDGGFSALTIDASGQAVERRLQLGTTDGKQTEVLSGLAEGDTVLIAESVSSTRRRESNPLSTQQIMRKPR